MEEDRFLEELRKLLADWEDSGYISNETTHLLREAEAQAASEIKEWNEAI